MSDAKAQLRLKVVTPTRVAVDVPCDEVTLPGATGEELEHRRAHLEAAVTRITVASRRLSRTC